MTQYVVVKVPVHLSGDAQSTVDFATTLGALVSSSGYCPDIELRIPCQRLDQQIQQSVQAGEGLNVAIF